MPEQVIHFGRLLEGLIGVPAFVLVALMMLGVMTYRFWPGPGVGPEMLLGRAMLAMLAVAGILLAVRYVGLLLQGDLVRANDRLSDVERGGMLLVLAFAMGVSGMHSLRSAWAPRASPPPLPSPTPELERAASDSPPRAS